MKTNYIFILSAFSALLTSCTSNTYVSNTVNVPLLKEKGEVKLNVDQTNAQLAVGVGKHWGLMANAFYKKFEKNDNYIHEGTLGEIGYGYFKPYRNNLVLEAYSGFGIGTVDHKQTFSTEENNPVWSSYSAQGTKAFLQPSIGYCAKYFDLALTPRVSVVKYTHFNAYGYTNEQLALDYLDNDRITKGVFIFGEPAFTVRAGYKFIKVQGQYGLTINLSQEKIKQSYSFASVGLVIDIARWYNTLKQEPGTK
jgi:hypothetical protein